MLGSGASGVETTIGVVPEEFPSVTFCVSTSTSLNSILAIASLGLSVVLSAMSLGTSRSFNIPVERSTGYHLAASFGLERFLRAALLFCYKV